MDTSDLTSSDDWDTYYIKQGLKIFPGWSPDPYYGQLLLYKAILKGIKKANPVSVLEIGCGNSTWLPYIAKNIGVRVSGIDYSELGCKLARERLRVEGMEGKIYCVNFLDAHPLEIGTHDLVYSLGVVEHFNDLDKVISTFLKFLNPNGILFTEIPNLFSVHGLLKWFWQPNNLAKHRIIKRSRLKLTYEKLGLVDIEVNYWGLFSLNMVAWGFDPRWPNLESFILPYIRRLANKIDRILNRLGIYKGIIPFFSPFIYAIGRKSDNP